jgi:hypothetical protein
VDKKKGTGKKGKTGRRSTAFESARGGAVERRRGRLGGPAVRMPRSAGRVWGLAPTSGWHPDRVPAAARAGRALCFEQERAAPGR